MIDLNSLQQLKQLVFCFFSRQKIGEAEAIYKAIPALYLSDSNIKCVYVATGWFESRYAFEKYVLDDKNNETLN